MWNGKIVQVRRDLHLRMDDLIESLLGIKHCVRYEDTNMSKLEFLLTV